MQLMGSEKLKSLSALAAEVKKHKAQGKKIAFTNGCFDLIHIGHIRYLKEAKKLADILIVAINSDKSVGKIKGKGRPIIPEGERAELLSGFEFVDYIVIFNELDPIKTIEAIVPDVLVKGGDWSIDKVLGRDIVEGHGGKVVTIQTVKGHSTSALIDSIWKKYGNRVA